LKNNLRKLIRASMLLAIAIVFQIIGRNTPQVSQFLVGPVVNAILILTAVVCGIQWGVGVGIITPILAWLVGQLAAPMAPFIPFIMAGNLLYVVCFGILNKYIKYGSYLGVGLGSLIKFAFLSISASKLVSIFSINIPSKVASKLIIAMGVPQLITAVIGGILALIFINILSKRKLI
jgi:riboflavin transporter